jgi:tetratricopeptide (TPR) repeat protein
VPRISLCLIARDEERFLPACLASARGAVDETIVVDTGSRDRTRKVAAASGATVVEFPWCDDFAAARNAGLERASGTHVLVLDCDERLARGAAATLRRAAEDARLAIGMLPLHDADALDAREEDVLSGARRLTAPSWLPRFFVRHPRLVFRRRVHETVLGELEHALRETRGELRAVDAPIVHLGEVRVLRAELGKAERNTRLLELALQDDPEDGELAGYLAMERARAGSLREAEAIAEHALGPFLAAIDALPPGAPRPSPVQLAQVLATAQLQRGAARAALETLAQAERRLLEPHPNLVFLAGGAHERLGETEAAERAYRRCLELDGKRFTIPVSAHFTDGAPRLRLAALELARGRHASALELLDGVAGTLELPARLMRAEARLVGRAPAEALRELEPLLARESPPPDLFALAAWATAMAGARDAALAQAAARAGDASWIEPRRRALLRAT